MWGVMVAKFKVWRVALLVVALTAVGAGAITLLRLTREAAFASRIDGASLLGRAHVPRHLWRSVRARHWQIVSNAHEDPSVGDAREGTRGVCSPGMVEVQGRMLLEREANPQAEGRIDFLQQKTCTDWIQREYPERCAKFDRDRWLKKSETFARKEMHYCVDRFEYPNVIGQYPIIFVSWYEAKELCQEQGKRLCTEDEWTFACEGEEGRPYPYGDGYTRSAETCVTDQLWTAYREGAMQQRDGAEAGIEMDRLWRGKPSGGQRECRSPAGVYDLTGNVDEWTTSVREGERPSIMKGGYWGPVRTRCRPSTRSHDQNHMFYQQGFRCCSAAESVVPEGRNDAPRAIVVPLQRELE
ncbi:MAG: hypothetical protein EXR75_05645 [Myxococcales bacterium]|nr:hypothetical protein [Myxococcales bacterium]